MTELHIEDVYPHNLSMVLIRANLIFLSGSIIYELRLGSSENLFRGWERMATSRLVDVKRDQSRRYKHFGENFNYFYKKEVYKGLL